MKPAHQHCHYCNKRLAQWLISLFIALSAFPAMGEQILTPSVLEDGRIINAEEAHALQQKGQALFVDVRNPINYGRGHIPKATSHPFPGKVCKNEGFDTPVIRFNPADLMAEKGNTIIFHSHGVTGWKSYKVAVLSIQAGYSNVLWFRGGYPVEH